MKASPIKTFCIALSLLFLMSFTVAFPALQETLRNDKAQSSITYVLVHPFHTVDGVTREVDSKLTLDINTKEIKHVQVTAPVKSFDSGNKTRDKDMLKVTDAAQYPEVQFTSSRIIPTNGKLMVEGQLTFHGETRNISFTAARARKGNELLVDGQFVINLEDYGIKRPSIFGLKVKDELTIYFHMVYPASSAGT